MFLEEENIESAKNMNTLRFNILNLKYQVFLEEIKLGLPQNVNT